MILLPTAYPPKKNTPTKTKPQNTTPKHDTHLKTQPHIPHFFTQKTATLLLPVDLAVDGNRDGDVTFTQADEPTQEKPYRFWINDDTDEDEDKEDPNSTPDSSNGSIGTQRNLEDFTRLWFKCDGLNDLLKDGTLQVGFKWKDATDSPSLNLYLAADPEGGDDYLKDETAAAEQLGGDYASKLITVSGGSPTYLDKSVFADFDGELHLLYEGVSEGKGQLTTVFKIDGQESDGAAIWLHLLNVRKMYERAKITPSDPDAFTEPSTYEPGSESYAIPPEPAISWTWDPWGNAFEEDPAEDKQYLVFVHGWNMTYLKAQKYGETMFKRLWHQGYKGRYAFVRWPTYTGLTSYNPSDYRAWKSGKGLAAFVNSLPAQYNKKITAHSMGNIVTGSALREGMGVEIYALLNAAVPAMCYDPDPTLYDAQFPGPTPDGDSDPITKELGFENKLSLANTNGAFLINFYLPDDTALKAWTGNNYNKPSFPYSYSSSRSPGKRIAMGISPFKQRYLRSLHESVAYATKSRTVTVGANGNTNGSIKGKINMNAQYQFGSNHSAEWLLRAQKTHAFYERLVKELELKPNQ